MQTADISEVDALQGERNVCHGKVGSSNVICEKEYCGALIDF